MQKPNGYAMGLPNVIVGNGGTMIRIAVTMNVRPDKRGELIQMLRELSLKIRKEQGFLGAHIIRKNGSRAGTIVFIEEWETRKVVDAYMNSDLFRVLRSAMKVLTNSAQIEFILKERDGYAKTYDYHSVS